MWSTQERRKISASLLLHRCSGVTWKSKAEISVLWNTFRSCHCGSGGILASKTLWGEVLDLAALISYSLSLYFRFYGNSNSGVKIQCLVKVFIPLKHLRATPCYMTAASILRYCKLCTSRDCIVLPIVFCKDAGAQSNRMRNISEHYLRIAADYQLDLNLVSHWPVLTDRYTVFKVGPCMF